MAAGELLATIMVPVGRYPDPLSDHLVAAGLDPALWWIPAPSCPWIHSEGVRLRGHGPPPSSQSDLITCDAWRTICGPRGLRIDRLPRSATKGDSGAICVGFDSMLSAAPDSSSVKHRAPTDPGQGPTPHSEVFRSPATAVRHR